MATPIPTPDLIIIWLDQHIDIGEQLDPERRLPDSPFEKNINDLIQFKANLDQGFDQIPHNLKAFSDENECLKGIGESSKNNLKIFFITSGTKGRLIAPKIMENYPSLKTIYVFCGYCKAHMDWASDCLENDIDRIFIEHHMDLLVRLLRDVAEYFIIEGEALLSRNEQLAYSAILYFTWAKLLFERANKFDSKLVVDRLKFVEDRIAYVEKLIQQLNKHHDVHESHESFQ